MGPGYPASDLILINLAVFPKQPLLRNNIYIQWPFRSQSQLQVIFYIKKMGNCQTVLIGYTTPDIGPNAQMKHEYKILIF